MNTLKKLLTNKIFLIGLLIRLAVMPFTGHYDIRGINFAVYQLPFHHVTDVYKIAECIGMLLDIRLMSYCTPSLPNILA